MPVIAINTYPYLSMNETIKYWSKIFTTFIKLHSIQQKKVKVYNMIIFYQGIRSCIKLNN